MSKLNILDDKVLDKMNKSRLKEHRARVYAYINGNFYSGCECCPGEYRPVDHDTPEFAEAMQYLKKVVYYYHRANNGETK